LTSLLRFLVRNVGVWLVIFAIAKLYFLLINTQAFGIDIMQFPAMWWNGLRLDLSVIGYILILPSLLFLIGKLTSHSVVRYLKVYYWLVFVVVIIVLATDPYFFLYWGQKANTSFTQFIGKENAGLASIELSHYLIALTFIILMISRFAYRWNKQLIQPFKTSYLGVLLLMAVVAIMIRSSFGKVPINISSAYYSSNNLYNSTAINAIWSALSTEVEKNKNKSMTFFDDAQAEQMYAEIYSDTSAIDYAKLISVNDSTNIVLIVLESFSAKTSGYLFGNEYASTPNLDKMMTEGITFTSAFASSFRSDKGLLALTYGIPATAHQTLTNFPDYLAPKPNIFKQFPADYHTSFYYGGDIEFANIKVLFKDANEVVVQKDFNSTQKNAWGVHDEVVFERFTSDFLGNNSPQFKMMFSLSSHEPFDVPGYNKKADKYLNSISYTDSCLSVMIETIRKSDKWKNTLIILTADHGTVRPNNAPVFDSTNFRIPMLMIGGAVKQDTVITSIVSQTQIPATLAVLKGRENVYPQPSVFTPVNKAFYSYFDGVVMVAPNCFQRFDFGLKRYADSTACLPPYEKAYFQISNKRFFSN
jgi:phosphoglycerol transferase MdoB-like AlkP superfamily enzyme